MTKVLTNEAAASNAAAGQAPFAAEFKQIVIKDIRAKWGKYSEDDLSSLKNKDDLVTQRAAKYGLEKSVAQRDRRFPGERPSDLNRRSRVKAAFLRPWRSREEVGLERAVITFDYSGEAELFPPRSRKYPRRTIWVQTICPAADAVRFAIEELPPELLIGAILEVDGERYGGEQIRRLYDADDFSLIRRPASEFQ